MTNLMEQVKSSGQDIDESLNKLDKDFVPLERIQEKENKNIENGEEEKNKNKKDLKNNFSYNKENKMKKVQNFSVITTGLSTAGGAVAGAAIGAKHGLKGIILGELIGAKLGYDAGKYGSAKKATHNKIYVIKKKANIKKSDDIKKLLKNNNIEVKTIKNYSEAQNFALAGALAGGYIATQVPKLIKKVGNVIKTTKTGEKIIKSAFVTKLKPMIDNSAVKTGAKIATVYAGLKLGSKAQNKIKEATKKEKIKQKMLKEMQKSM